VEVILSPASRASDRFSSFSHGLRRGLSSCAPSGGSISQGSAPGQFCTLSPVPCHWGSTAAAVGYRLAPPSGGSISQGFASGSGSPCTDWTAEPFRGVLQQALVRSPGNT